MYSILLVIIYIAFISLGLPDSLLGSAWPIMSEDFSASLSSAGIISMIISAGTIISSLFSDKLTQKLGTGLVTAVSVCLTAMALLGFSLSNSFIILCILAVPYGLGAGAVDAALNNYVALHYASRHMSWLHCFWGVGATIGPYIMGWAIGANHGWHTGYRIVSVIQIALTLLLFLTLSIWKKSKSENIDHEDYTATVGLRDAFNICGVKEILLAFFCYCSFESVSGLWASSYLVEYKNVAPKTAAFFASMFYIGITAGRFISGFVCNQIGDKNMIRIGIAIMGSGIALIALPADNVVFALTGLVVIGIGAAPIYPSIIHSTPDHFGKENSHAIVGIQMASAYCGSTLMPPVFGIVAQYIHIALYPMFMAVLAFILFAMTERVNKKCKDKTHFINS